mmetsp:Transcript_13577/g.57086  ORF Transcript_13577/g.57086 Transcript_13577/m.57086 type:complete len:102 (+) Transcript_13577:2-307(+)
MIPFSVEFEQELWDLRADEEAQKAFLETAEGAKSALPKMVVQRPCRLAGGKTRPLVGRGFSSTQLANTFCARRDVAFRSSFFARRSSSPTKATKNHERPSH